MQLSNSNHQPNSNNDEENDEDSDEYLEENDQDDASSSKSDSPSSTASLSSESITSDSSASTKPKSTTSQLIRLKKRKGSQSHKVIILEDNKVSEALKDLQIEVDSDDNLDKSPKFLSQQITISKNDDQIDEENEKNDELKNRNILISDQLKHSLKEYQNFDEFILSKMKSKVSEPNKLQLILWQPPPPPASPSPRFQSENTGHTKSKFNINNFGNDSADRKRENELNFYTVEEPVETKKSEKNSLKRSFSQVSKISIEELKSFNNARGSQILNTPEYLVDLNDELEHNSKHLPVNESNNLIIQDITDGDSLMADTNGKSSINILNKKETIEEDGVNEKMDFF